MKNRILIATLATLCPVLLAAATHTVKVNADGTFTPSVVYINSGDTVEWTLTGAADSIIPVNWDGASSFCSAVRPYSAADPNEFTGPMPKAVSGIFTLSPLEAGFTVEPLRALCSSGGRPLAAAGGEMLCRGNAPIGATMDITWQDPSLTGVFIRLLWKDIQLAPGSADSSFDFTILDREVDKAVRNGKVYSLAIKAGDDGTPAWLFTNGVTALQLQDSGSDDDAGCGSRMTLGSPTDINFQNHYFTLLRKIAAHLKSRADWYRALAYIKPSGANLFSHENRLPKRCSAGCVCNTQVFAEHGYTPAGLYAFYQAQTSLLVSELPNKTMVYALIQEGFPRVSNSGAYETVSGNSSGGPLPGGTEQTQTIINNGQAAHGLLFAVAHNGLTTKKTDNCLSNINGVGCPNKFVLQEGLEGQVTGWQTNNAEKVATPADVDSSLLNALSNSQGVYVELYEERFWEAVRQPGGIVDPAGSGRTMLQWGNELHSRRRTLFANIPDPFPTTYRFTFTRTLSNATANQTFYYVNGSKCGATASPAAVVVLPPGGTAPVRRRVARH